MIGMIAATKESVDTTLSPRAHRLIRLAAIGVIVGLVVWPTPPKTPPVPVEASHQAPAPVLVAIGR